MENPASKGASKASAQGSTGVDQDRGMCEEKRNDDRSSMGGTLNSGGPVPLPSGNRRDVGSRQQGDTDAGIRESDPPIVVRDGSTGHTAKGRAGRQRKHRYHHGTRLLPNTVSNSLLAMGSGSGTLSRNWFQVCAS